MIGRSCWFLLCLLSILPACSGPVLRDPLREASLLSATAYRGSRRADATLNIAPVIDERALDAVPPSEAERQLAIPTVDLVRSYVLREVVRAGLLEDVRADAVSTTDLELEIRLLAFSGSTRGTVAQPTGSGEAEFEASIRRVENGELLHRQRYVHRVSESRVMLMQPDPLELACAALQAVVEDLLVDIDRLDLRGI